MAFDRGPVEFPIAIVRSRAAGARTALLAHELGAWVGARWTWLRQRTIPVVVAALGAAFVLMSADYLAHGQPAQHLRPHSVTISVLPR